MLVENTSPYVGKLRFKLEKYPYYVGGKRWSKLNRVHLDLGFTKLVSRIYPNNDNGKLELNKSKLQQINTYTGGKIGTYEWWDCYSKKTGRYKKITKKPNPDIYDIKYHATLEDSFLSKNNEYIGDVEDGWWYVKNQLKVSDKYPLGVAIKYEKDAYDTQYLTLGDIPPDKIVGYYGYSHRGGALFEIGDKIFDETYEPNENDYNPWEWAGWVQEYDMALEDAKKRKDDFDVRDIESDGVSRYIPFAKRGNKIIETWQDAELAAYNLSKYLS